MRVRSVLNQSLGLLSLGVFAVSLFSLYQTYLTQGALFNSDSIYLASLYRDVVELGGQWSNWRLTPAPFLFPDGVLYALFEALIHNFQHSLIYMQFVLWVGLAATSGWVLSLLLPSVSRSLVYSASFLLHGWIARLMLIPLLGSSETSQIVDLLLVRHGSPSVNSLALPGYHVGSLLMVIVTIGLWLKLLSPQAMQPSTRWQDFLKKPLWWVLLLVSALTNFSDSLFSAQWLAPSLLVVGLVSLITRQPVWRQALIALTISAVAGYGGSWVLKHGLIHHDALHNYTHLALKSIRSSFTALWQNARQAPVIHLAVGGFYMGCAVAFARSLKAFRQQAPGPDTVQALSQSALWLAIPLMTMVVLVIFGKYTTLDHDYSIRYMLPVFYLPLVGMTGWFLWQFNQRSHRLASTAVAASLLCLTLSLSWPTSWALPAYRNPVAQCLDQVTQKYQLKHGLSHYWHAKLLTLFSATGNHIAPVLRDQQPQPKVPYTGFFWINSRQDFEPRFDYIFWSPHLSDINYHIDRQALTQTFGSPKAIEHCGQEEIWIYKGNEKFATQFKTGVIPILEP